MNAASDPGKSAGEVDPRSPVYGRVAARGMAWVTVAALLGRVAGFAAQFVLGWLLSKGDFGVFGIAMAVSAVVIQLRTIGTDRVLLQRAAEFDQLAGPMAKLTGIFNTCAALLLAAAAIPAATFYENSTIASLVWVIAVSLPVGVPAQIMRAKLSVDLKFKQLATLNLIVFVFRHGLTVALALTGWGPFSLALPMLAVSIFESVVLTATVGWWERGRPLTWDLTRELLAAAKWILACGIASTIMAQAYVLVLGRFASTETTGIFVFGLQMVVSMGDLFKTGMFAVLMPTLSRLVSEPQRHGAAFLRTVGEFSLVAYPICVSVAFASPSLIHLFWQGKWDDAVPVISFLVATLPAYLVFSIAGITLESRGEWRLNTISHYVNAAGTLAAAIVGIALGSILGITLAAAVFRIGIGLLQGLFVTRHLRQSATAFRQEVIPPLLVCIVASGVAWLVSSEVADGERQLWSGIVATAVFLLITLVLYRTILWQRVRRILLLFVWQPKPSTAT